MKVIISGHSSFYMRGSWLNKLFYKVFKCDTNKKIDKAFFSKGNLIKAIDTLGIGSKMVESLKYWLDIFSIVDKKGNILELSECAKIIFELDPYLENKNSLWLLHSNIFTKKDEKVLIWDLAFSSNSTSTFTKESLEKRAEYYCTENRIKYSKKTLVDTINVFIKTYLKDDKNSLDPEDSIVSPFVKLEYLKEDKGVYRIKNIERKNISEYLIYYLFIKKLRSTGITNQITISEAYDYVNKIIRISYLEFEKIIQTLENEKEICVDRAVGLQNITIDTHRYSEREIIKKILESELVE